jgi:hypothetical protein
VPSQLPTPLRSERDGEIEFQPEIARFVLGLTARIDSIQDAVASSRWPGLADATRQLASEAEAHGFPLLARRAAETAAASDAEKPDALRDRVQDLTQLARRVFRGHATPS